MVTSVTPTELRRRVVDRYRVVGEPPDNALHCDETPGIVVRIDASFAFSESEARKLGPRSILLDGAGRFAPLIDGDAKLYNLDHHQGCVRSFTLATCEQAVVLVAKGLELDRGSWTLYANEPDLDVVLAIWVLLNHRRVVALSEAERRILLPLIRLEGAIDAGGTEASAFCGLPEPALGEARKRLDHLFQREQSLRALPSLDASARTAALLREVDALVFAETEIEASAPVDEVYGNVELSDELVAVACRDSAGIYDVERRLRERWGARLGLIALHNPPGKYTLRASGAIGGISLEPLFAFLNLVDPAVDGRPASQRWGGSSEIGGSPRDRHSALTPDGVLRAARWVQRRPLRLARAIRRALIATAALTLAVLALGVGIALIPGFAGPSTLGGAALLSLFGAGALASSAALARRQASESLWIPGWRAPAGRAWLLLAPVAIAASAFGFALVPAQAPEDLLSLASTVSAALLAAFGVEAWFRGWVHGLLTLASPPRASEKPPRLSTATLVSSASYAGVLLLAALAGLHLGTLSPIQDLLPRAGVAGIAGLVLGIMRERSLSLWPGILAQLIAAGIYLVPLG